MGLPPAPRGVPQIEVTFDIDANGIVNASAKDLATGKEQKITITASSGLSKDEVDRMTRDADTHAEEDKKAREAVETRNRAEQGAYGAEKMLQDAGDKIGPAEKAAVESAIEEVKKALESNDAAQISRALDSLNAAQSKAAEMLYKNAAASASQPGSAPGADASNAGESKPDGDVIDAEVVEEEKK